MITTLFSDYSKISKKNAKQKTPLNYYLLYFAGGGRGKYCVETQELHIKSYTARIKFKKEEKNSKTLSTRMNYLNNNLYLKLRIAATALSIDFFVALCY